MLLYNARDLFDNPPALFAYLGAFIVAIVTGIAFHEFSHAWAANELGDDTAKRQGRLTLNPAAHIEPLGALLLLLVGFGWGRPTPVDPNRLRTGPKLGNMLVALAGPISNFVFATIAALPLKLGWIDSIATLNGIRDASGEQIVGLFLFFVVFYNVILGIFNLIPIPPLDGFKVAVGILPGEASRQLQRLDQYGMGILLAVFAIGFVAPQYSPIRFIVGPLSDRIMRIIL